MSDYVQNGELICFGLSEHVVEEHMPEWNARAIADFKMVSAVSLDSFYLLLLQDQRMVPQARTEGSHQARLQV